MIHADPSEFMPTDTDTLLDVYCKFPVENIQRLLHAVEESLCFEPGNLIDKLLDTIDRALREISVTVKESCVYDDVSVVVCYEVPTTIDQIKHSIARACFFFWQHNIVFTKEGQEALMAVREKSH
jgi:hypothetical protein